MNLPPELVRFLRAAQHVAGLSRRLIDQAYPNPDHQALAGLQAYFPHFTLITQHAG